MPVKKIFLQKNSARKNQKQKVVKIQQIMIAVMMKIQNAMHVKKIFLQKNSARKNQKQKVVKIQQIMIAVMMKHQNVLLVKINLLQKKSARKNQKQKVVKFAKKNADLVRIVIKKQIVHYVTKRFVPNV